MKKNVFVSCIAFAAVCIMLAFSPAQAANQALSDIPSEVVLFKNVKVFNGTDDMLHDVDVLVVGNTIRKVEKDIPTTGTYEVDVKAGTSRKVTVGSSMDYNVYTLYLYEDQGTSEKKEVEVKVIDGGGRTLMPGLIDSHIHFSLYTPANMAARANVDPFLAATIATARAQKMLMRGFTTVRDTGGPSRYIRQAVESGNIIGPRVYGSGTMITQTSGHGDFRDWNTKHPNMSYTGPQHWLERYMSHIADGHDEVLRAGRESLMHGGLFLKLFTSGGVSSEFDPLHMEQYTPGEIQASVTVANQWKTYVTVHAFTDDGVRMAVDNGVKCVEHVPLISEDTARYLKENGIFVEVNVATVLSRTLDELKPTMSPASFEKAKVAINGQRKALEYLAKHDAKMVYGTDLVAPWDQTMATEEALQLGEFEVLKDYFTPIQILRAVTSTGGELAALTGPNNPWKEGPLGVIQEGAYADILLVDGNPLQDITVMSTDKNFDLIMKDGVIYKDTL